MVRKSDKPKSMKRKKVYLTFDENARKDYLTGFRKRRNERKAQAQHELDQKLKDKVKQERTKRKKTTQEKVDKMLEYVSNIPGEENEGETTETGTVDFGTHEVIVKSCIDFSESGLIVAPSKNDSDEPPPEKVVNKRKIDLGHEKVVKKKKIDLGHKRNKKQFKSISKDKSKGKSKGKYKGNSKEDPKEKPKGRSKR